MLFLLCLFGFCFIIFCRDGNVLQGWSQSKLQEMLIALCWGRQAIERIQVWVSFIQESGLRSRQARRTRKLPHESENTSSLLVST